MSDNTQVQSDKEQAAQSSEQVVQEQNQEWSAEQLTQRLGKANAEAKEYRKKLQEQKRLNEETQRRALEEQGQYKELMEVYKRDAEESKSYAGKLKDAFAMKIINDSVAMEAQKLGCVDPEALSSLVNLQELPIDENFNVDRNHVRTLLEDMKKQKPYFFKVSTPKIPDAIPAKPEAPKVKSINEMNNKEIENVLLTKFGKK